MLALSDDWELDSEVALWELSEVRLASLVGVIEQPAMIVTARAAIGSRVSLNMPEGGRKGRTHPAAR